MFHEGQRLTGRKFAYVLVQLLNTKKHVQSALWKAQIVAIGSSQNKIPAEYAILKTTSWQRYEWLGREQTAYRQPSIGRSAYIRSMYDEINEFKVRSDFKSDEAFQTAVNQKPYCLVLEYLDYTLDDLDPEQYKRNLVFVANFFKCMLTGASDIDRAEAIWTDGKAENILCSSPDSSEPVLKIGDMGLCGPRGFVKQQVQPKKTRAPEVWAGHPCNHVADVWSIAATFVSWIDHTVFGPSDIKAGIPFEDPWCMAKIMLGFETAEDEMPEPPETTTELIRNHHRTARLLLGQQDDGTPESMHVPAQPFFATVLPRLGLAPQVGDLLRRMLVLDPEKRPTAKTLLQSNEYEALLTAAAK